MGSNSWGSLGGVVAMGDQQATGGLQSPGNTNVSLSNTGPSLNTIDTAMFSSDIFDWAMGLGSEPLDAPNQ